MLSTPTTWLHVSGYRFLLRRIECALLRRDVATVNQSLRAHSVSLSVGCVLAAIALGGCAFLAVLQPRPALDHAQIVMDQASGALYVRVGETWHPVLNLASARLIAATDAVPQPVRESELSRTKRGPLLGIPGAPQLLAKPLPSAESVWTICDTDGDATTTVVVAPTEGAHVRQLAPDETILVARAPGSPSYLLYNGHRAVVDLADKAVLRALRLEGLIPRIVSQALLNAAPEVPPIALPQIRGVGTRGMGALSGFRVGSVLRIARSDGDDYFVVLDSGVQRVGRVAADLLRFSDSLGTAHMITVAPDVIRAMPIVNTLAVSTFPDRVSAPRAAASTLCVTWEPSPSGRASVGFLGGSDLPLPPGGAPVTLAQADGRGPAVDAVYVPPGRTAYVRSSSLAGDPAGGETRYLVTDTGVRFAIHDDDTAHRLGMPAMAVPAPWPILAGLPSGQELSRENASVARDSVRVGPP